MGAIGPALGSLAAAVIAWLSLRQRFYRQPFGDWRAVGLWFLVVGLDLSIFLLTAGGYVAKNGAPHHHVTTVIGWVLAGIAAPLAIRSPVRETTVRGTTRPVGVTFVYDWLRATMEDPLDGRLAELRRREEKSRALSLMDAGWSADGMLKELQDHLSHLQRRSPTERARVLATAKTAARNLQSPDDLRGIIVAVETARCGSFLNGLKNVTPY